VSVEGIISTIVYSDPMARVALPSPLPEYLREHGKMVKHAYGRSLSLLASILSRWEAGDTIYRRSDGKKYVVTCIEFSIDRGVIYRAEPVRVGSLGGGFSKKLRFVPQEIQGRAQVSVESGMSSGLSRAMAWRKDAEKTVGKVFRSLTAYLNN